MATCSPSELIAASKCFACLSKQQLQAVIAQLLCNINASSGGSGSQTPWLQNVDAGGFSLSNLNSLQFKNTGLPDEGYIKNNAGDEIINTKTRALTGGSAIDTLNWNTGQLVDNNDVPAGNWMLRQLYDSTGDVPMLDWSSLSGLTQSRDGVNFHKIPISKSGTAALVAQTSFNVVFSVAMPTANYSIAVLGTAAIASPLISAKATTGFTINFSSFTGTVNWMVVELTE